MVNSTDLDRLISTFNRLSLIGKANFLYGLEQKVLNNYKINPDLIPAFFEIYKTNKKHFGGRILYVLSESVINGVNFENHVEELINLLKKEQNLSFKEKFIGLLRIEFARTTDVNKLKTYKKLLIENNLAKSRVMEFLDYHLSVKSGLKSKPIDAPDEAFKVIKDNIRTRAMKGPNRVKPLTHILK